MPPKQEPTGRREEYSTPSLRPSHTSHYLNDIARLYIISQSLILMGRFVFSQICNFSLNYFMFVWYNSQQRNQKFLCCEYFGIQIFRRSRYWLMYKESASPDSSRIPLRGTPRETEFFRKNPVSSDLSESSERDLH